MSIFRRCIGTELVLACCSMIPNIWPCQTTAPLRSSLLLCFYTREHFENYTNEFSRRRLCLFLISIEYIIAITDVFTMEQCSLSSFFSSHSLHFIQNYTFLGSRILYGFEKTCCTHCVVGIKSPTYITTTQLLKEVRIDWWKWYFKELGMWMIRNYPITYKVFISLLLLFTHRGPLINLWDLQTSIYYLFNVAADGTDVYATFILYSIDIGTPN